MALERFKNPILAATTAVAVGLGGAACSPGEGETRHQGPPIITEANCEDRFTTVLDGQDISWARLNESGAIAVTTHDRPSDLDGVWPMERPRSEVLAGGQGPEAAEQAWDNLRYAVGCLAGQRSGANEYTVWVRESYPNPSPNEAAAELRANLISQRASEELDVPVSPENNGAEVLQYDGSIQIVFVGPAR